MNFSKVREAFDENGKILDEKTWSERAANFLDELLWISEVLRYGREHFSQE